MRMVQIQYEVNRHRISLLLGRGGEENLQIGDFEPGRWHKITYFHVYFSLDEILKGLGMARRVRNSVLQG